ncbi:hypothetical protein LCGC14_1292080 [marine sediment metagenome]|uniref:Uncharacterized protein n=1 Tax=marine sediment metagenome TaxID=412755 RepID=A0A0F9NV00_9ZZZZ
MVTTLPSRTRILDDAFAEVWELIRAETIDNILTATPVWALLQDAGVFTKQVGGNTISRTIKHGKVTSTAVAKGDTLSQGEPELETVAFWTPRNIAVHVQRDLLDDVANAGAYKIKDYVKKRLDDAIQSLKEKYEADLFGTIVLLETGKEIQGLDDMIPLDDANGKPGSTGTATYGKIDRNNDWWQPVYKALTANPEVNLLSDMKNIYNTISAHRLDATPTNIVMTQTHFEIYEEFALDQSQIIKDESTRLADLGFEVLRFKGKPVMWSANQTASQMLFLNTRFIEVVFDPNLWFHMTNFKDIPLMTRRIAHILSRCNVISTQLRNQGRLGHD